MLVACGDDSTEGAAPDETTTTGELRPAGDVNAEEEESQAVTGSIGEPARLINDFGQDVIVVLRSVDVIEDGDRGRLLVVDVRAENATDGAQNAPEFELLCAGENMDFFGGTYEWQEMPAGTFLEGTREFAYPETCSDPQLLATAMVGNGESVRWDVTA